MCIESAGNTHDHPGGYWNADRFLRFYGFNLLLRRYGCVDSDAIHEKERTQTH